MVYVVDTGNPIVVAIISHNAEPNSAQAMARRSGAGFALNREISMMLLLMVSVT